MVIVDLGVHLGETLFPLSRASHPYLPTVPHCIHTKLPLYGGHTINATVGCLQNLPFTVIEMPSHYGGVAQDGLGTAVLVFSVHFFNTFGDRQGLLSVCGMLSLGTRARSERACNRHLI